MPLWKHTCSLFVGDDDGAADSARYLLELLAEHGPAERLEAVAALCAEHGLQVDGSDESAGSNVSDDD